MVEEKATNDVGARITDSQYEKLKVIREENPQLTSFASVIKFLIEKHNSLQKETEKLDIDRTNIDKWLMDLNKT